MLYALYKLGIFLANILPLRGGYAVAEFAAGVYFRFAREGRKELGRNLAVVLGEGASAREVDRHVLGVFRNFAKYLVDFFRFPDLDEKFISSRVRIEGIENLDSCLKAGKGVITLSIHLGNWELGGAVLGAMGYPISALVLGHENPRINAFFTRQRTRNGLKPIPVGMPIKGCFQALKQNQVLAIVGDKNYTSGGVEVDLFGKKAMLPAGPALFSLKTGAPIVCCIMAREKDDIFRFRFEEPIRHDQTGDRDGDIRSLMKEYIRFFEKAIREYPDQWYVFKEIWKQE